MQSYENSWRSPNLQQKAIAKINEAILQSGATFSLTSAEMENLIFTKSDNRDEYISFVTRLILHVHEMGKLKKIQIAPEVPSEPTEIMETNPGPEEIEPTTQDNSLIVKIKNDEYDWKSPMFRKNILEKINAVLIKTGSNYPRNSVEIEKNLFDTARNKDEYLSFAARLIIHAPAISQSLRDKAQ